MRWHLVALLLAMAISPRCPVAFGDEATAARPTIEPIEDAPSLARWVTAVSDVILLRHIDPPTRQEMIRTGLKSVFAALDREPPGELSDRISSITTADELAAYLTELWPVIGKLPNVPDGSDDETPVDATPAGAELDLLARTFLAGMLRPVSGRPDLVPTSEAKVQAQLAANRYVGIGIALDYDNQESYPRIVGIFPAGPAAKAGAVQGDLIVEIDGASTKGIGLQESIRRLRGDEGSEITMVVRQRDQRMTRTLHLVRGVVPRQTVRGYHNTGPEQWDCRVHPSVPIAYLSIDEIGGSALHELRQYEQRLQAEGMRALILDFRSNDAGNAHYAVALADGLLSGGTIGRIRSRDGVKNYQADADCLFRDWPMAVLVDERTAGVHAWIAAGLQDARRAVLVGSPSLNPEPNITSAVELPGVRDLLRLATAELKPARDLDLDRLNKVLAAARVATGSGRSALGSAGASTSEKYLALLPDHVVHPQPQPQETSLSGWWGFLMPRENRTHLPKDGSVADDEPTAEATRQPVRDDPVLDKAVQLLQAKLSVPGR